MGASFQFSRTGRSGLTLSALMRVCNIGNYLRDQEIASSRTTLKPMPENDRTIRFESFDSRFWAKRV
jgi:hypothetical protein